MVIKIPETLERMKICLLLKKDPFVSFLSHKLQDEMGFKRRKLVIQVHDEYFFSSLKFVAQKGGLQKTELFRKK